MIQFKERNLSAKELAELSGSDLLVRDIWYTIQGEGPFAGWPAVFIRLAGCNRGAKEGCQFCDADFLVDRSSSMSVINIFSRVKKLAKSNLVVITGGEPLLHSNLLELVSLLQEYQYIVQLETNGDLVRQNTLPFATLVASPKISAATGKYTKPHKEMLDRVDYLKLLVSSEEDHPYHALPFYLPEFVAAKGEESVFISPINEHSRELGIGEIASMWGDLYDKDKCSKNHAYAARIVLENGFRLSLQTHAFVAVS